MAAEHEQGGQTEWVFEAADTAAMEALGARLASAVLPLLVGGFTIDLRGELGMGKTVFVRGLARGLGVPRRIPVTSPTFTVARSYAIEAPGGAEVTLQHVDAYRLRDAREMDAAGFEEMCGKRMLTCVEWGGRVETALPEDRLEVTVTLSAPDALPLDLSEVPEVPRRVHLRALGPRARACLERMAKDAS